MVPFGPQDAPRPMGASQMIVAGPPPMSMRFSLASAKKPMERLSGDQKGKVASSVPGIGCGVRLSIERKKSCCLPCA